MNQPSAAVGNPTGITKGLRTYLYATAGITGAAVLIVEILGAKMLSPYIGSSHFVWTAQIAVTLISLAIGYYLGGRLVDAKPRFGVMYIATLIAAVYLAMTMYVVEPIAYACLKEFRLPVAALLCSAFLFFVPLTLLAMVGPFLIRLLVPALHMLGKHAGIVSAISTIGSVAGTTLISYVLLPLLPNSTTMLLTAGVLTVLSIVYFIGWGRRESKIAPTTLTLLVLTMSALTIQNERARRYSNGEELMRVNSDFGLLQVMRTHDGRMFFLNDFLTQNTYDPQARKSMSLFTYMLAELPYSYTDKVQHVLCIGMGVGIAPMEFANRGAKVDVVEINERILPLAEKHFNLQPSKLNIEIGDGRYFLNKTTTRYDAIALDAFLGDSSPSHLMTREAFTAMRKALCPGGVLVINSFGDFQPGKDFFMRALWKTLHATFPHVRIHSSGNGNVFWVASDEPLNLRREPDYEAMPAYIAPQVRSAYNGIVKVDPTDAPVLTDDFNPVDFHDAANREEHRRAMAFSMRPEQLQKR